MAPLGPAYPALHYMSSPTTATNNKRKRRPAGTPDPDAEVVSLSPKTLMESDRYVCEICKQGFQRDQNLQMHRRRHKVPWKLLKRETPQTRKRVFVCPEPTCLHHHPSHALGDLVGIKKHFRRKHSSCKLWTCDKCSKGYAVQSDFKAHLKTCGTRGHTCNCGRVFSRVESFIEHQDTCGAMEENGGPSLSESVKIYNRNATTSATFTAFLGPRRELQLMPFNQESGFTVQNCSEPDYDPINEEGPHSPENEESSLAVQLSIGLSSQNESKKSGKQSKCGSSSDLRLNLSDTTENNTRADPENEQPMDYIKNMRKVAKMQLELAHAEFARAEGLRRQAQAELAEAQLLKEKACREIDSLNQITSLACEACREKFQSRHGENKHTNNILPANKLVMALPFFATPQSPCEEISKRMLSHKIPISNSLSSYVTYSRHA